jgi:hypothetical protein
VSRLGGLGAIVACGVLLAPAAHGTTGAACPVTIHGSRTRPPARFLGPLPVLYVHAWLGSRAIWLRLPRHGIIPAQRDAGGRTISAKFPWWRVLGGQLRASARPVGRTGARVEADVAPASDYGPKGFVPSFLRFSGPGCWRITGTLRGHSISFVARVVRGRP